MRRRDFMISAAAVAAMPLTAAAAPAIQFISMQEVFDLDLDVIDGWTIPEDGGAPKRVTTAAPWQVKTDKRLTSAQMQRRIERPAMTDDWSFQW